mgnify:CR=1 FL=1
MPASSPRIARAVNLLALIPVLGRERFEAVVVGAAVGAWVGAGATAGVGVEPPLGAGVGWVLGVHCITELRAVPDPRTVTDLCILIG